MISVMFGLGKITGQKLANALSPEIDQVWNLIVGFYGDEASVDAVMWSAFQTAFSLDRYRKKISVDDSIEVTFFALEKVASFSKIWVGDPNLQVRFSTALQQANIAITGEWYENPTFGFLQARLRAGEHWIVAHQYYVDVLVPFFRSAQPRIASRLKNLSS